MQNLYPYKILFIEDERMTRENYTAYLKLYFSEVYEAEDGEEAYRLYKEKKPDIMIIDINIPKMSGLELLAKIRENDHKTKAIILTAHTDTSLLLDAVSLKLTKYLVKPVSKKDLIDVLELTIDELLRYSISSIQKIDLPQDYSWHSQLKELKKHNILVNLTKRERAILELLFSYKNRIFTYDEIFNFAWEDEESININSLKNVIKRLRKKLPKDTIVNIFSEGYKINF